MEESNKKEQRQRVAVNRWILNNREQLIRELGEPAVEKLLSLTKIKYQRRGRRPSGMEFPYINRTNELFEMWQQPQPLDELVDEDGISYPIRTRQMISELVDEEDILEALRDRPAERYKSAIKSVQVDKPTDLAHLICACVELGWMESNHKVDKKTYYNAYFALFASNGSSNPLLPYAMPQSKPKQKNKFSYEAYRLESYLIDKTKVDEIKSELLREYKAAPDSDIIEWARFQLEEYIDELYYGVWPDY